VLVGIYRPLVGGSYKPLPEKLKGISNKILLNVYNPNDDRCFVWSVLCSIHRIDEQQWDRERYVPYESELDLSVFSEYPVGLKDIAAFERAIKISVLGFGFENGEPCIYRVSQFEEGNHHVDLLYLDHHYVAILDFNKFVAAFNENRNLKYFCRRCMHGFRDQERFEREHKPQCKDVPFQSTVLPMEETAQLSFRTYKNELKRLYVAYADFECLLPPVSGCNPTGSYTAVTQMHVPCSFCYVIVNHLGQIFSKKLYRGADCMEEFYRSIKTEQENISKYVNEHDQRMKPLTASEKFDFDTAKKCHICRMYFEDEDPVVRDHDHITGQYRGAAHSKCNVAYTLNTNLLIVLHNFQNYDSHLIVTGLKHYGDKIDKVKVIGKNKEKFASLQVGQFTFIDSFAYSSFCVGIFGCEPPYVSYHRRNIQRPMRQARGWSET